MWSKKIPNVLSFDRHKISFSYEKNKSRTQTQKYLNRIRIVSFDNVSHDDQHKNVKYHLYLDIICTAVSMYAE